MGKSSANPMVVVVAMVSALLIGLELSWRQAKAGPDWQTVPVAHAPNGPVVAR